MCLYLTWRKYKFRYNKVMAKQYKLEEHIYLCDELEPFWEGIQDYLVILCLCLVYDVTVIEPKTFSHRLIIAIFLVLLFVLIISV